MDRLPNELWLLILSHTDGDSLTHMSRTCWRQRNLAFTELKAREKRLHALMHDFNVIYRDLPLTIAQVEQENDIDGPVAECFRRKNERLEELLRLLDAEAPVKTGSIQIGFINRPSAYRLRIKILEAGASLARDAQRLLYIRSLANAFDVSSRLRPREYLRVQAESIENRMDPSALLHLLRENSDLFTKYARHEFAFRYQRTSPLWGDRVWQQNPKPGQLTPSKIFQKQMVDFCRLIRLIQKDAALWPDEVIYAIYGGNIDAMTGRSRSWYHSARKDYRAVMHQIKIRAKWAAQDRIGSIHCLWQI